MTVVLQVLVATALIAVFVVLRLNSDESVARHRRSCARAGDGHAGGGCNGGCGSHEKDGQESNEQNFKRSI
ncbi:MAG: hypothetical protein GWM87_12900 [Xanthomonadales bacterium]|nr:hypothetical protein [Xanthomonadales bacterium]NIX13727.1 hypothetical protein [Xanthomonadales bacterium]